jgi:hypothetical protein
LRSLDCLDNILHLGKLVNSFEATLFYLCSPPAAAQEQVSH